MCFFGFMDETGVLSNDVAQPYFALGLLRLHDTSRLLQKITAIKAKHKGIIIANSKKEDSKMGELKFSSLKSKKFLPMYQEIIQTCLSYEHFYFSIFIIDKEKVRKQTTVWDTHLRFAKAHIKQHCKDGHQIAILADYLNKPKDGLFFEDEIRKLKQVFNAYMLESDTSAFIQIVDLFIGAIVYRYKNPSNSSKHLNRAPKMQLVQYIEQELNKYTIQNQNTYKGSLKGNFTIFGDKFYFSVYEK
ncbi:DUF3800 domain-containing protein [Helicobacter pametensis]|uniref:DUF3800 domain-containing protein n=1 Tax=Helicobacter pametensis TaxID=95149 RepID=UPI000487D673|nr:DUF3800 domain-containing protein [Helicobacter pametensis]